MPNGGFVLCWEAGAKACDQEQTVFADAFIIAALQDVFDVRIKAIKPKALALLESQQEPGGFWRFWHSSDARHATVGPDLDDIACAAALLGDRLPADHAEKLAQFQVAGGAVVTWTNPALLSPAHRQYRDELLGQGWGKAAPEGNDIDCALNANVLWYTALRGHPMKGICEYLNQVIVQQQVPECSLYYPSAMLVNYFISRAYAAGAACLSESISELEKSIVAKQLPDGSWGNDLDTAAAMVALMHLRSGFKGLGRAAAVLVKDQRADGSWAGFPFIRANHGSEAVTTAICLQALSMYNDAIGRPQR